MVHIRLHDPVWSSSARMGVVAAGTSVGVLPIDTPVLSRKIIPSSRSISQGFDYNGIVMLYVHSIRD